MADESTTGGAGAPGLVLHGGIVVSPAPQERVAGSAIAIRGGRILAVGGGIDVLALAGPGTRVVDLRGAAVVPGFQDQHAHPLAEGLALAEAPDLQAALRLVAGAAGEARSSLDPERWVEARYDPSAWPDGWDPSRDALDRVSPDIPILLHHESGHLAVANSVALALAGIHAGSADTPGATIERDASGEPTGVVRGSDPVGPFAAALPPLTPEVLRSALRRVAERLARCGVTAVADADLGALGDPIAELAAYAGAALDGDFPFRLTLMPGLARLAAVDEDPPSPADIAALLPPDAGRTIRIGAAKFYADGALTAGDAWLREPYADAEARSPALARGRPAHDPGALAERLRRAHETGWQLATHAIGDAAIAATLQAYGAALAASPRPDHRHRVEHAMLLPPDLLAAATALGVVAMVQPAFVAASGDTYLDRLGPGRAADLYALRRSLDAGLAVAFSSDRPFSAGPPLDGIRAAFRFAGRSGRRLGGDPGPTPDEALAAWTSRPAWAARDEAESGRLAPGMRADLAVLGEDPLAVPAERWAAGDDGVEVLATLVGGEPVWGGALLD
jgi:predicted amidohydrolase YtcJ